MAGSRHEAVEVVVRDLGDTAVATVVMVGEAMIGDKDLKIQVDSLLVQQVNLHRVFPKYLGQHQHSKATRQ